MRVLELGCTGDDVQAWKTFLVGQAFYWLEANEVFDDATADATGDWQRELGLDDDGRVGPSTYAAAKALGFAPEPSNDSPNDEHGPNWPPKPAFSPLGARERADLLGEFSYRPATGDAIVITDDWAKKNIVQVAIPQLTGLAGLTSKTVQLHAKCASQFQDFFQAVDDAGLRNRLLSWGGAWAPRFVRGSRTYLSNHAYGSAVDVNVRWNMLGCVPALKDKLGSVRELVSIANSFGLYWGGHFKRPDGMHFELAKLV